MRPFYSPSRCGGVARSTPVATGDPPVSLHPQRGLHRQFRVFSPPPIDIACRFRVARQRVRARQYFAEAGSAVSPRAAAAG